MANYTRTKSGVKASQLRDELNDALPIECVGVRIDNDSAVQMNFAGALDATQQSTMESVLAAHIAQTNEIDSYVPNAAVPDSAWASVVGNILNVSFIDTTTSFANRWLGTTGDKLPSNTNPFIMPYKAKLIGITFASQTNNCALDAEVYRGDEYGITQERVATLQVRGARFQRKTNFNTPIVFAAGETVGVYATRAAGDKTRYPLVTLFLQVIEDGFAESANNTTSTLTRV